MVETFEQSAIAARGFRRNAFAVPPAKRNMPDKTRGEDEARIRPSISKDMALLADHLTGNPMFVDLMGILRKEAVDKLTASPLGANGIADREVARYELEALSQLESRLLSMAAEIRLYPEAE